MRALYSFAFAALHAHCYPHGWPFDDKSMCPAGPSYPIAEEECEHRMRAAEEPRTPPDAGPRDAASASEADVAHP